MQSFFQTVQNVEKELTSWHSMAKEFTELIVYYLRNMDQQIHYLNVIFLFFLSLKLLLLTGLLSRIFKCVKLELMCIT